MKKIDPRLMLAVAAAGLVMALWLVLMSVIVWSTLDAQERLAVGEVLASRTRCWWPWAGCWACFWWRARCMCCTAAMWATRTACWKNPGLVVTATTPQQLTPRGTAEMQALARAVNELAAQRDQLRARMAAQVAQASHSVQQRRTGSPP
jgi:DNA polymerase-3 subunit epsilon